VTSPSRILRALPTIIWQGKAVTVEKKAGAGEDDSRLEVQGLLLLLVV
jgi:hypothetical protein